MAERYPQFHYTRCVLRGAAEAGVRVGGIDQVVLADHGKLGGWRAFLCGDPVLVNMLRKKVFLAGASMKEIYADAFVTRADVPKAVVA